MSVTRDNLLLLIVADLRRYFAVILLGIVLLFSAFYNVYITHETRKLVTQKDQLAQQKDNLMIEWQNLLLEEHTLDEHSRIRRIAKEKLSMSQPTKNNSVLVEIP
ncbi:cell division protein FtsL [Psychromonas sp. Urea-02u-13]|uniref:cell division protein FtsL n=1 Tax=Psychromonas sp. Urea-02u-13 TaxID=2058326 RepID=UPI000C323EF0|nr:cell division protein FtsL [Psychromonas sp. Urea-02u-13]PKG39635.1 cell division protein FtsL [Psychromonas sp. Urea-02u-13]